MSIHKVSNHRSWQVFAFSSSRRNMQRVSKGQDRICKALSPRLHSVGRLWADIMVSGHHRLPTLAAFPSKEQHQSMLFVEAFNECQNDRLEPM